MDVYVKSTIVMLIFAVGWSLFSLVTTYKKKANRWWMMDDRNNSINTKIDEDSTDFCALPDYEKQKENFRTFVRKKSKKKKWGIKYEKTKSQDLTFFLFYYTKF